DRAVGGREAGRGAFGVERLGDPPGDRMVVGDPEDERRLSVEQSHPSPPACRCPAAYHRAMTTDGLRAALRGVRGLVLDSDGVLVLPAKALPGSVDAVRSLDERGIPFRVVTNFSQLHRETLAAWFEKGGVRIAPDRIITAVSATGTYAADAHDGAPVLV